jgi:beta-glucosidase
MWATRWYDAYKQDPLFPFGHGLSYTTFRYSDLKIDRLDKYQANVSLHVTNTGKRAGAEVVQLYIGSPAVAEEPPKQLRGFEKIILKPGESKIVSMKLDKSSLSAWDSENHAWKAFLGTYSIMAGSSSRDIRLTGSFIVDAN